MNIEDITIGQGKLAMVFGLTKRQIRNLAKNGIVPVIEGDSPRYPLLDSVRAYVAFLRRPKRRRRRIVSVRPVKLDELADVTAGGIMGRKSESD